VQLAQFGVDIDELIDRMTASWGLAAAREFRTTFFEQPKYCLRFRAHKRFIAMCHAGGPPTRGFGMAKSPRSLRTRTPFLARGAHVM
jgi:hypothetical protein